MPSVGSVPAAFAAALARLGDRPILEDKDGTVPYTTLLANAATLATALEGRGLKRGERVGLWADNSRRWIVADLAIQVAGGVNVPRGTDTPEAEILEILHHSEAAFLFVHDLKTLARLDRIRQQLPALREVAVLDPRGVPGLTLDRLVEEGRQLEARGTSEAADAGGRGGRSFAERAARITSDDVATLIYTSGTTGRPKGVILTQGNFAHQIEEIPGFLDIGPDDVFLSILPPWHIFERIVEYVALTQGARLVYTDLRHFRQDLADKRPTFVPSVPRVWESVHDAVKKSLSDGPPLRRAIFGTAFAVADARARAYDTARGFTSNVEPVSFLRRALAGIAAGLLWPLDALLRRIAFKKVQAMVGGRLRGAVVGGGKMPPHVDRFFRAIGVGVLVGYGLTETSPVVTVRRPRRNVLHTIGSIVPRVELEIRDPVTGKALPVGETGVVFTKGPHVMRGYHKDAELTARVIDAAGWFDTGDLGRLTRAGDLCFRGRQKETIVLAGGENVEPSRVEEAIAPSSYVAQGIVVGQDRKTLACLVVPRADEIEKRLPDTKGLSASALADRADVLALVKEDLARRTGAGSGLKPFEVVNRVALLPEPLSLDNGCMTATLKPKRHEIVKRFADRIDAAYR